MSLSFLLLFFFFNDTATTEIYTLSLHDALPICQDARHLLDLVEFADPLGHVPGSRLELDAQVVVLGDRKSTRLNSSHQIISYAVFCLKKKKKQCSSCSTMDAEKQRRRTSRDSRM